MKSTQTIHLTDEDVRFAVQDYIAFEFKTHIDPADIRFSVTVGYNGEMGGKPTPNTVEAIVEIEQ